MKKILMFVGTVTCVLALTAGTASAHFCYNSKRSAQGNAKVTERSNGFATYAQMLAEFGLCAGGIAHVEEFGPDSIPLDVPVNSHAVMASGTFRSGNDAKGVDHIDATQAEWDAFDATIDDAFESCDV